MRFNKEGTLLAVTTADNGIKILANADGLRTLRTVESRSYEASRAPMEKVVIFDPHGNPPSLSLVFCMMICCSELGLLHVMDQVASSAFIGKINPVLTNMERAERSSPTRPTPILVVFPITTLGFSSESLFLWQQLFNDC